MALSKVNTGCRDAEVCGLRWEWEVEVPELETSVFVIPGDRVKNGADRLVVLNSVARSIIDEQRGLHPEYVFVYSQVCKAGKEPQFRPIETMNNTSGQNAAARTCRRCGSMISSTPSAGGFGRQACPSKTGRICSGTSLRG